MEEQVIICTNSAYPLKGILTMPETWIGKVPAAVFVHGSGPLDMDETIGATKMFRDLATGLAQRGIASLRYNKRTHSYGKQMLEELGGSLSVEEEIIQDAICAANMLKADSRVDSARVFLIGHSQGGMLAPRIDAEGGDFAGIVILAGTIRTLDEVILDQNADVLEQLDEAQREAAIPQIQALKDMFDSIDDMSEETAKQTLIIPQSNVYAWYLKEMRQHPVRRYLKQTKKPFFVIMGDKDVQVSVSKDFEKYQEILNSNENAVCKLYSGLNHLFMKAIYGTITQVLEEYNVQQYMDTDVLQDIAQWISNCDTGK